MLKKTFFVCSLFFLLLSSSVLKAQNPVLLGQDTTRRPINTAVPFLNIAPDARAAGMGDVGVATSADANSTHWNPSKLAFIDKKYGFSLSYSPWLRKLVGDMSLAYLSGYYKIDNLQTVAIDLRYFNLGNIQFTNNAGGVIRDFTPREFAISATYARKLSENLSVAVTGRYINSNLTADLIIGGQTETKPGNAGAVDLSLFYKSNDVDVFGFNSNFAFGFNISNIGTKISYSNSGNRDFIPMNLRVGGAYTMNIDVDNKFTFALDFSKLLVPTPPQINSQGQIVKGKNPQDVTVLQSIFTSFGDAPGGISEEIKEVSIGIGAEYWYKNLFAARIGYFNESAEKGNRKYFTVGIGGRYNVFGLDVAYLFSQGQNNPLADTLRFTFLFNFAEDKNKNR